LKFALPRQNGNVFFSLQEKIAKRKRVIKEGLVQCVIVGQVSELKPDLLVIGIHGWTDVVHALLASFAEGPFRDPPCDVLAV
jgi:hypothetical protein